MGVRWITTTSTRGSRTSSLVRLATPTNKRIWFWSAVSLVTNSVLNWTSSGSTWRPRRTVKPLRLCTASTRKRWARSIRGSKSLGLLMRLMLRRRLLVPLWRQLFQK